MPNTLAEFSATLWRIAKFVLDATLTVLCTCLMLAGMLVPWRMPFVARSLQRAKFDKLQDYQEFAAGQFLLSLLDVLVLAFVVPSLVWPLRWHRAAQLICRSWRSSDDRGDFHEKDYSLQLRGDLSLNAASSYADLLMLPLACVAMVALWRWTPIQTKGLREALQEDTWSERLSAVRNWAGWNGFSAIVDLPSVAMGLASVVVPTRLPAFLSVLITRDGFQNREDDCEARGYLLVLPFLAVADVIAGCLAFVGLINPLRSARTLRLLSSCWRDEGEDGALGLSTQFQKAVCWNAELRRRAVLIGLCSLMDVLVLPLSLVVCATLYRASPLLAQIWPSAAQDHEGAPEASASASLSSNTGGQLAELPFSPLHRAAFQQFALIVMDLLSLPSSCLVLATWYRWKHLPAHMQKVRERCASASAVAYHAAVVANSCVILHDVVLLICSFSLLVTVYRIPAASRALRGEEPRVRLWQEMGHLLLDLPLLPLYLILLCTLWRADLVTSKMLKAESNCDRRRAVLWEFLELLRDGLGWLALLVLAATLVRLPKVLLDICAQRAQPVTGQPRLRLTSVRLRCPPDSATDRRLVIHAEGLQEGSRERCEIGSIRINVISSRFWDEIGRLLGSGVASLGRALLPYTLVDGKHLDYNGFLPASASIELRLGGKDMKAKLLQLDENMAMCVQIEHKNPNGAVEVMARLPIPMQPLQQAVRRPGETVEVAEEMLTASPEVVCGPLLAGAGIRNALWLCAFQELWQLCLDVLHLLLFALLVVAPWRLVACAYFTCAPSAKWLAALTSQAVSLMRLRGAMLRQYRRGLEPALNAAAKDPVQRTREKLCQVVAREQARTPLPKGRAQQALVLELAKFGPQSAGFIEQLKLHSSLQDAAASYWPSLTLGANLQLAVQAFEPEEHALALLMVSEAQSTADQLSAKSMDKLQAESDALRDAAAAEPCRCSLLSKSCPELRRFVQIFALEGAKDYLTVVLAVLLLVSVYRMPNVLRGIRHDRQSELKHRVRAVLNCEVRLLLWDMWMLLTTVGASILALVTLVRSFEFMQTAFLHCSTLRQVRRAALDALSEAAHHWWELILLLTLWKTYKTLVHASVCALLLPAYSLEVGPFALRIVLWLGLCALPWTTLPFQYVLLAFLLVILGCFLSARSLPCRLRVEASAAAAPRMRITGMNFLVLASIIAEGALLASVSVLRPLLAQEGYFSAAAVVVGLWLLLIALPHTQPEGLASDQGASQSLGVLSSAKFHMGLQLLRRAGALPAAVVLLVHCGGPLSRWSSMLLAFLAFTTALGTDMHAHFQGLLPRGLGLDALQPPAFLAGLILAQLLFVAQVLYVESLGPWWWLLVSALLPAWVVSFQCIQGVGGPLWLFPMQLGASAAPVWSQLAQALGMPHSAQLAGYGTLVLLSVVGMAGADRRAWHRQQRAMAEAGVPKMMEDLVQRLHQKGALISHLGSPESAAALPPLGWESPQGLANALEAFEAATRTERLSAPFLGQRREWLAELRAGRDDCTIVVQCGLRLLDALCTPSSTVQTMCLLRRHAARKLPRDIWKMIMAFVSDVRVVSRILEPAVSHFGPGEPETQVVRGWASMKKAGKWLTQHRQEENEEWLAHYLANWWQEDEERGGAFRRKRKARQAAPNSNPFEHSLQSLQAMRSPGSGPSEGASSQEAPANQELGTRGASSM